MNCFTNLWIVRHSVNRLVPVWQSESHFPNPFHQSVSIFTGYIKPNLGYSFLWTLQRRSNNLLLVFSFISCFSINIRNMNFRIDRTTERNRVRLILLPLHHCTSLSLSGWSWKKYKIRLILGTLFIRYESNLATNLKYVKSTCLNFAKTFFFWGQLLVYYGGTKLVLWTPKIVYSLGKIG